MIGSGIAAMVLVAVAFPLALTMRGTTTIQTVAVGDGQASAAQTELPLAASAFQDDSADGAVQEDSVQIQVRAGDDFSLSIQVLSGEQAVVAAQAAAAAADETLDVDDITVWVSGSGDQRTVAALVEPNEFVEVTGDADQLDKLIEVLRNGGLDHRGDRQGHGFPGGGLHGMDDAQWQEFFDRFESEDFDFSHDGGFGDLEQFFGPDGEFAELEDLFGPDVEFGELEQFFGPDGGFAELEDLFGLDGFDLDGFNFDSEFGDLEQFFGPDGEFGELEDLFGPNGFSFDSEFGDFEDFFGPNGFDFDGCIMVDHADGATGDSMHFEFPHGCGSTG